VACTIPQRNLFQDFLDAANSYNSFIIVNYIKTILEWNVMKWPTTLIFLFLLSIPFSYADIVITTDQNAYNLGNKIRISASVLNENDLEGLFRTTIKCGEYNLQYFLTPISLQKGYRTALNVPDLGVTNSMIGQCMINAELMTNENSIIESQATDAFSITDQLSILPVNEKMTVLPGDRIIVTGIVNEAFGNNVLSADTSMILDKDTSNTIAIDGKFEFPLDISRITKSGKHLIFIEAKDKKNNLGKATIELEIAAIPSKVIIEISNQSVMPGTKIYITSKLLDQADDLVDMSLNLELNEKNGKNIFRKIVQSNETIDYEFSQYAKPGEYIIKADYNNIIGIAYVTVLPVHQINIKYYNQSVLVENIGNIPFEEELIFILSDNAKNFPITRSLFIEPGRYAQIDVSKEVPGGIYDVIMEAKSSIAASNGSGSAIIRIAKDNLAELLNGKGTVASQVLIEDNRPIPKKIGSAISDLTGNLVGADGILAKNPLVAPVIVVVLLVLTIFYYSRKRITHMFQKEEKPKEENKWEKLQ